MRTPENIKILLEEQTDNKGLIIEVNSSVWAVFKKHPEREEEYGFQVVNPNTGETSRGTWGLSEKECTRVINKLKPEWQQRRDMKKVQYERIEKRCMEIRNMPKYQTWRKQVFEKWGHVCEVCGETENLEIHHRKSLYSIVKNNKLMNILLSRTIECDELWDPNNGSVLCKPHHDEQESSQQRKILSEEND